MNKIPEKRHPSPDEHQPNLPVAARQTRHGLIAAAIVWAVVMFFALPALSAPRFGQVRRPIEFQVVTTVITVLVLFGLARSVRGWRHYLVAPLWAILIFMEYIAWIWPIHR